MGLQGDVGTHLWLSRGMAARVGVSLDEVLHQGTLTREDFNGMVTRCRSCRQPADCLAFQRAAGATCAEPPDYCENRALLAQLRDLG